MLCRMQRGFFVVIALIIVVVIVLRALLQGAAITIESVLQDVGL